MSVPIIKSKSCPFCGSNKIEAQSNSICNDEAETILQYMKCNNKDCEKEWNSTSTKVERDKL